MQMFLNMKQFISFSDQVESVGRKWILHVTCFIVLFWNVYHFEDSLGYNQVLRLFFKLSPHFVGNKFNYIPKWKNDN